MNNITKAFLEVDRTVKQINEISKDRNKKDDGGWSASIGARTNFSPEELPCQKTEENPLIWETTIPDHNKYYNVFLFKTTERYYKKRPNISNEDERKLILEESETRKVFLKEEGVEFGITIEDSLREPNENVWGFTFGGYKYYIIKNGKLTISKNRADIRKVYNNKSIEEPIPTVRIETETTWYSTEIENLAFLYKARKYKADGELYTYECEIDGEEYLLSTDDGLDVYAHHLINEEEYREYLIEYLGGRNKIIDMYCSGYSVDTNNIFKYEFKDMLSFLGLEEIDWDDNQTMIVHSNVDEKIIGLRLYKKL